jgi:hypothetical protein
VKQTRGQYVRHSIFGWGTIMECDRHHTTVYFYDVGVRKLATSETIFEEAEGQVTVERPGH